jgi:hypothetical protein
MPCKSTTLYDIESCDGAAIAEALVTENLAQMQADLGINWTVSIVVGAEAADVINVALQVEDAEGNALAEQKSFLAWLSDTAVAALTGTAPSAGTAIGTDGIIIVEHTAETLFELLTDSAGVLDLDIGEAGIDTWFLNIRLADGSIVSSATITFA